ncbi:MAG TPA: BTAD domain-containing putative transcriptional regulator [Candidatus Elarobacter sp.]|nr:BTAD domain-containing putative transcriptional regulator [Candidatus Elarobacter sp.]
MLRDVTGMLATPGGLDLIAELVGALPVERTLAISTRANLPPALAQIIARERAVTIGIAELALQRGDVIDLARAVGVPDAPANALYDVARGWPLVSRLFIERLRRDASDGLMAAAAALPASSLLAFAAHRVVAGLDGVDRDALVVAALLRGATHAELIRVLGTDCDDLVFARLSGLACVVVDGERAIVHPEVVSLLRSRFGSLVKALYDRTVHVLTGDGAYAKAAHVALDGGDVHRAAAIIDAAPPYTAAPVRLGDYERIIDRLERGLITRYPNVWLATIPYRSFAVDRATFVREAETVYYCLPHAATADQRALALMLLASSYTNVGRFAESDHLVDEALRGFAREHSAARASLLNFSAWMRGMEGRFSLARSLAAEAAGISRDRFGEDQTLQYIDAHDAAFHGKNDRVVIIIDELLRRLETDEVPLHRAHTATNGALFTWVNGDDEAFERYITVLEESLTPGIERGFAPMIYAARGRAIQLDDGVQWPVTAAVAHLYRLGTASDPDEALEAARAAVRAADERRDPYVQTLAHAALYVLDEPARAAEAVTLEAILAPVESAEMKAAVHALIQGKPAGILDTFVRRRVLRDRERPSARLTIELLAGRIVRGGGVPIRLTDKEFELLALLASTHGSLSRDRIGEVLWDHLDPDEWPNNLKVTLSRLRSKLSMPDAVVSCEGRYRLSPAIDVDLPRAEAVVRSESGKGLMSDKTRAELHSIIAAYRSGAIGRYDRCARIQPLLVRVNDVVCTAACALATDALAAKRYDDALAHASDVVEIDPFNEAACETIIRVHLACGRTDAARREFRRHAAALRDELGATPAKRVAELIRSAT